MIVEVLGYHQLTDDDKADLEAILAAMRVLPIAGAVRLRLRLRQARKMLLGDALIAATALLHGLPLWMHNVKDFAGIHGLVVFDPLANGDP